MTGSPNPISQCGTINLYAFASKDLLLAVQGQMISKFRKQHVRQ